MTDYPIPDELRDQFARQWFLRVFHAYTCFSDEDYRFAVDALDRLAAAGFHVELRLPDLAVHDDTCCGGSKIEIRTGLDGESQHVHGCPGVAYYHWTRQ